MKELKRFENDLKASDELKGKLEEALKHIADEGKAQSDGEAMVQAAKELGYNISITALEQAKAAAQDLDAEALQQVSGGTSDMCLKDYQCIYLYKHDSDDKDGHTALCLAVWHCFTAAIHTEGETKDEACWSDYRCVYINEDRMTPF